MVNLPIGTSAREWGIFKISQFEYHWVNNAGLNKILLKNISSIPVPLEALVVLDIQDNLGDQVEGNLQVQVDGRMKVLAVLEKKSQNFNDNKHFEVNSD